MWACIVIFRFENVNVIVVYFWSFYILISITLYLIIVSTMSKHLWQQETRKACHIHSVLMIEKRFACIFILIKIYCSPYIVLLIHHNLPPFCIPPLQWWRYSKHSSRVFHIHVPDSHIMKSNRTPACVWFDALCVYHLFINFFNYMAVNIRGKIDYRVDASNTAFVDPSLDYNHKKINLLNMQLCDVQLLYWNCIIRLQYWILSYRPNDMTLL